MYRIEKIIARCLELPLPTPFETAKRRATTSPTVLVEVHAGDVVGYGEATPVKYVTGEDVNTVKANVSAASDVLSGTMLHEYRLSAAKLAEVLPTAKSARAGIEMAILDAFSKSLNVPLYAFLGGSPLPIETDITFSIGTIEQANERALDMSKRGFRRFKIKVGKDEEEDIARILAVKDAVPDCTFIFDANQGFKPKQAVNFIKKLQKYDVNITLLEQPVDAADLIGLKYVTDNVDIPVFADEAAQTTKEVIEIVRLKASNGVNIKLQKSGMLGALDIISICKSAGMDLMFGCMLESGIGQSASVHIACGTHAFSVFDLDSDLLTADQPIKSGVTRTGAILNVSDRAGLGCEVIEDTIGNYISE